MVRVFQRCRRLNIMMRSRFLGVTGILLLLIVATVQSAPPRRPAPPQPKLPDLKSPEDKLKFLEMIRGSYKVIQQGKTLTFDSDDLDRDLERSIAKGTSTPFAPVCDDETFIRRASLDATGVIPDRDQIKKFVANTDPKKRAKLIDDLLLTDAYARKCARYWTSVLFYDSNANRNMVNRQALEEYFFEQFKAGTSWDRIVGELISASPQRPARESSPGRMARVQCVHPIDGKPRS